MYIGLKTKQNKTQKSTKRNTKTQKTHKKTQTGGKKGEGLSTYVKSNFRILKLLATHCLQSE